MSIDGFSMHRLARELNETLAGGRIDKVTQPGRAAIQLSVRQPGQNHLLCLSIHPQNPALYLLQTALDPPSEPPSFCMLLRKHLETGRIAQVRQHGLDRILLLDVDFLAAGGRIVTKTIVAELMGKYSNLILTENGAIIDALRRIGESSSRVRRVLPGLAYTLPPDGGKLDARKVSPAALIARLAGQPEEKLAKAVSNACLGFGPVTAKEIAFAAGLSPELPVGHMDEADFAALAEAFSVVLRAIEDDGAPPTLLRDANGKLRAMAAFPLRHCPDAETESFSSMSEMLSRAAALIGSYTPPDKERFQKLLRGEQSRAAAKLQKLRLEASEAQNAEDFRRKADNLMTYQTRLADHKDKEAVVPDIYAEDGAPIAIALDRRITIQQNIQEYYKKYAKLRRAQALVARQIALCEENLRYLASVEQSLASSSSLAELGDIRAELIASGLLREKVKKKPGAKPSEPFRFRAPDGSEILVGKNNLQNDRLTFRTADRDDLWLHTKDTPGSHVILRTGGAEPSEEALRLAASLAAHFSRAAGSSNVPVDYTRCRFVKKPSGAKPGFVIFTRQKTLFVTPDETELARVLHE